jgi:hypothetical protein
MKKLLWLLALGFAYIGSFCHAQQCDTSVMTAAQREDRITVSGTIKDPTGAVVPSATIALKRKPCKCSDCKPEKDCGCCANQVTVHSDSSGNFSFSVAHGTYELSVFAGERSATLPLDLTEGTSKTLNITVQ